MDSLSSGSLTRNEIFYEGMQTALKEGTVDENDIVLFVEICYCLEGGLYPMPSGNGNSCIKEIL
jgi:hypothetical protein